MTTFPELLDAKIVDHELSEGEVARLLGVSQPTVSRWRRGALVPSRDSTAAIARFLRIHHAELELLLDRSRESYDQVEPGTVGALLRRIEDDRGLTVLEAIERYGIDRSRYYRLRANLIVPKLESLAELAEQLEANIDEMVLAVYRTAVSRRRP